MMPILRLLIQKNTIRDGGCTALYSAYTVNTVNLVHTVNTAYTVILLKLLYTTWWASEQKVECMGDRGDGYPLDCMTTKAPVMLKCEIKRKNWPCQLSLPRDLSRSWTDLTKVSLSRLLSTSVGRADGTSSQPVWSFFLLRCPLICGRRWEF